MKRKFAIFILLFAAILFGAWLGAALRPENFQLRGKLSFDPAQVPSADYPVLNFVLRWDAGAGQITVEDANRPGFALWQTIPGEAFVMAANGDETVTESRSMYNISDDWTDTCTSQSIEKIEESFGEIILSGTLTCGLTTQPYSVNFGAGSADMLRFGVHLDDEESYNRVFLTYASEPEEHFFGFGEQFTYFDMKGRKVPVWVSEQGVGRGGQPITLAADLTNGGAGGNAFTTYAPMPLYITNQTRFVSLRDEEYSIFDLEKNDRVQVEVFSKDMSVLVFSGESPAELLKAYTGMTGNMLALPDWIYKSAIVGMQGGTDKVRDIYAKLQERDTPITAFWLQDWVGQRTTSFGKQLWWNWEVDYERYPGWEQLVSDLNSDGVEVMVYASPYLADLTDLKPNMRRNLFQEAKDNGYLVRNAAGEPYLILNTDFYFGMVDLTNRDAFEWYKSVIKEQVVGAGAKGWMADFGEGLPYDAVLANGDAASVHNAYPVLWALLNREVVDETGKELVFFNRAAYTGSPQYATLFWEGDQLVDWSEEDGIKSAVTGLNTSGLSGMAYNHSDIGGYTTISNPVLNIHRSRELLYRWMEMNAFTLIFRTHEGNQPDNNVQFYTDDETLDTFSYWAKVYAALFDYRKSLVAEAAGSGMPVVRHPFIQYPDDPETWKITYQEFMLGADFLVAPVTDEGATEITAYLPKGEWVHLWSGQTYTGGQYVTIPAPIGQPGVFYAKGSQWGEELVTALTAQGLMGK